MRILAGSCVKQVPEVLKAHLQTLQWQTGGHTVDLCFVDDCDDMEAKLMLPGHVMVADPKPEKAEYAVSEQTHHWSETTFGWLGRQKQRLIDYAKAHRYDGLFLVDSDLLCAPDTLNSLIETRKDVVSAVFWTKWQPQSPPLPQVWLAHPYELRGRGLEEHEFLGKLARRELTRVAGLGACTFIRSNVFDKVAYWPFVEGLPSGGMWQGEDRHFCITAERNHVELWADPWADVVHVYRPSDRPLIPKHLAFVSGHSTALFGYIPLEQLDNATRKPYVGDLISAQFQPLEEPNISGHVVHVRGRLGQLKLLPEVEKALLSMRVGESRIVKVNFPLWYEVAPYRGQSKLIQIKLIGAKPYTEAAELAA